MDRNMWHNIMQFDRMTSKRACMFLLLGDSIYFICALCGDYKEPAYMAYLSAAFVMALLFYTMVYFTRREGEHWRSLYEKIRYFPVDRKKYLLAKAVPAGEVLGLQLVIQWAVFGCRMLMHRGIAPEAMGLISLAVIVSGIWYFLTFLGLLAAGERALILFPVPFLMGLGLVNVLCNTMIK